MNTAEANRVETLAKMYATRRDLEVKRMAVPGDIEGAELYRISWTHQTLSHRGNSEDRRVVYWRAYLHGQYVYSAPRRASALEALASAAEAVSL